MSPVPKVPRPHAPAAEPRTPARLSYESEPVRVLWIGLGGAVATILTFGIYRFWLRTYLRRHHWSRMTLAGDPFEYRGRAIELLSGALIAIVILAVYLALVATALNFMTLLYFDGQWAGSGAVLIILGLPLAPLWPYAAYRARRYFLTRLSWRGIRFSLELAAWRYVRLTLWLWFLTIISLGVLKPYADFQREAFILSRTRYGDKVLKLAGSPRQLFRGFYPMFWTLAIFLSLTLLSFVLTGEVATGGMIAGLSFAPFLLALVGCYFWYLSFRLQYFVKNTQVGDISLETTLTPGRIFRVYIASMVLTGVVVAIAGFVLSWLVIGQFTILLADSAAGQLLADILGVPPFEAAATLAQILIALAMFGVYSACSEAFFYTLALGAVASSTKISDLKALEATRRSELERDQSAEGFADALGVDGF